MAINAKMVLFFRIYLLIRPKKGIAPADRLNVILETPIFQDWKINKPDKVAKLIPIAGDILEPNLGLSKEDIETVTENVSIVFHSDVMSVHVILEWIFHVH